MLLIVRKVKAKIKCPDLEIYPLLSDKNLKMGGQWAELLTNEGFLSNRQAIIPVG